MVSVRYAPERLVCANKEVSVRGRHGSQSSFPQRIRRQNLKLWTGLKDERIAALVQGVNLFFWSQDE